MLHCKCPRCRRGDMFKGAVYNFGSNTIQEFCSHCRFRFEIEPGYFYAAMYVSYSLNIMYGGILWTATYMLTHSESPWLYISVILGGCFLLSPITFRYSRVFLLYWLSPKVHYQPHLDNDDPDKNL
jgi:uncharacterized protein (DUF983 family)